MPRSGSRFIKFPGPRPKLWEASWYWGDGTDEALTCVAGIADIEAMAEDDNFTALAHFTHSYKTPGRYQVRTGCAGGFLRLRNCRTKRFPLTPLYPNSRAAKRMPEAAFCPLTPCRSL